MTLKSKRAHFIGIGGAGMSGLAEIFFRRGFVVQGSDIKNAKTTERLAAMGIGVTLGHSAENIKGADYVVYSSCIRDDNEELKEARRKKIRVLRRIEALNLLLGPETKLVAVSGSHGKTTTSSLISYLLLKAGLDPTVFIGADVSFLNGNARYGHSDIVVTEADESDGSFLLLNPLYSVSTNVDREHMDYYPGMDSVIKAYAGFIENTKDGGKAFVCADDARLKNIAENSSKNIIRYGFSEYSGIKAENIENLGMEGSLFDLAVKGEVIGKIRLSLPGTHNILNSLAAIGVAMEFGLSVEIIKNVIAGFKGAARRFVINSIERDILIIDDYAHHPTEIEATLKVMENSGRRIVVVFQPHRYSRTKDLREQFGRCFDMADYLIITDIYSAHEIPLEDVSAMDLCESARRHGHKRVNFMPKGDIIKHLENELRPKDALFILGAGDIDELPEKIVRNMQR